MSNQPTLFDGARLQMTVCFCADHTQCHRTLLAGFLGKLGANVVGERSADEQKRVST